MSHFILVGCIVNICSAVTSQLIGGIINQQPGYLYLESSIDASTGESQPTFKLDMTQNLVVDINGNSNWSPISQPNNRWISPYCWVVSYPHRTLGNQTARIINGNSEVKNGLYAPTFIDDFKRYKNSISPFEDLKQPVTKELLLNYKDALYKGMSIGFLYNTSLYIMEHNLEIPGQRISSFRRYNMYTQLWTDFKTGGDGPELNLGGHSAEIWGGALYLTHEGAESIYILDLITLLWTRHHILGFLGARDGFLMVYQNILVHCFGFLNNLPSRKTQIVRMDTWTKVHQVDFGTKTIIELGADKFNSSKLYIILGFIIGGVTLIILALTFFYIRHRKKTNNKLRASSHPDYLEGMIWADASDLADIDIKIDSSPSTSYDSTLSGSYYLAGASKDNKLNTLSKL